MKNTYTIEDYVELHSLIKCILGVINSFEFFDEVANKIIKILAVREITNDELEGLVGAWLLKRYPNDANLICNFLYETEFENVALYINNPKLRPFVQWRLKISK